MLIKNEVTCGRLFRQATLVDGLDDEIPSKDFINWTDDDIWDIVDSDYEINCYIIVGGAFDDEKDGISDHSSGIDDDTNVMSNSYNEKSTPVANVTRNIKGRLFCRVDDGAINLHVS